MHFSIPQANLPKLYLEYSPISCCFFLPMWSFLSKPLYISMRRKNTLFSTQSNKKEQSICGPCQFLIFVTKHLVKNQSIYLKTWKNLNLNGKIWKSEEFVWKCEGCLKKNEQIWRNDEFDSKSERICLEKYGNVKNLHGNVKDFCRKIEKYGKMTTSFGKVKEIIWSNGILSIGF